MQVDGCGVVICTTTDTPEDPNPSPPPAFGPRGAKNPGFDLRVYFRGRAVVTVGPVAVEHGHRAIHGAACSKRALASGCLNMCTAFGFNGLGAGDQGLVLA